ncbi:MAG TPA: hypothetical protein VJ647_06180 [Chitinophagaceae bacterium]|nr:hypothetical protein [Chitinophagaceae bacterium]
MSLLRKSNSVSHRQRIPLEEKTETGNSREIMQKLDLLLNRNQYLEKEYAKIARQLKEEKENLAARGAALQQLNELEAKCVSLQTKNADITQRMNEYHKQMQQAKSETIAIRRKLSGILGHIQAALARDSRPGSRDKMPTSPYEAMQQENKLLKWKLNVVEGCLNSMFSEEVSNS